MGAMLVRKVCSAEQLAALKTAAQVAQRLGSRIFLVGGLVRDLLCGAVVGQRDLDLVVEGDALGCAEGVQIELGGRVQHFDAFLTAKLVRPDRTGGIREIDFACARTERYPSPGSLPEIQAATLAEDLQRRDFTINAMAIELCALLLWLEERGAEPAGLTEILIDQFRGCLDLQKRQVRVLHELSFIDDPTRMYRACRYAERVGGWIEPTTLQLLEAAVAGGALNTISLFRRLNELRKCFVEPEPDRVWQRTQDLGLLAEALSFPEERRAPYLAALKRLGTLGQAWSLDYRLGVGYRLWILAAEENLEQLAALGLGKKVSRAVAQDVRLIVSGDCVGLSYEGLGAALLLEIEGAVAAAKREGLVVL